MITRVAGHSAASTGSTSRPLDCGMLMSSSTTSGVF